MRRWGDDRLVHGPAQRADVEERPDGQTEQAGDHRYEPMFSQQPRPPWSKRRAEWPPPLLRSVTRQDPAWEFAPSSRPPPPLRLGDLNPRFLRPTPIPPQTGSGRH